MPAHLAIRKSARAGRRGSLPLQSRFRFLNRNRTSNSHGRTQRSAPTRNSLTGRRTDLPRRSLVGEPIDGPTSPVRKYKIGQPKPRADTAVRPYAEFGNGTSSVLTASQFSRRPNRWSSIPGAEVQNRISGSAGGRGSPPLHGIFGIHAYLLIRADTAAHPHTILPHPTTATPNPSPH